MTDGRPRMTRPWREIRRDDDPASRERGAAIRARMERALLLWRIAAIVAPVLALLLLLALALVVTRGVGV